MKNLYTVNLARALFLLRRAGVAWVANITEIPAANISAFLFGNPEALTGAETIRLFYALGVGEKNKKICLIGDSVHVFHIRSGHGFPSQNAKLCFRYLRTILAPDYRAIKLPITQRRVFPVLVKSRETRILLLVDCSAVVTTPSLLDLGVNTRLKYRGEKVPLSLADATFKGMVCKNDFDSLFEGRFHNWNLVARYANHHGIPFVRVMGLLQEEKRLLDEKTLTKSPTPAKDRGLKIVPGNHICGKEVANVAGAESNVG